MLAQNYNKCIHPACQHPLYDPCSEQRFCFECHGWIHLECIDSDNIITVTSVLVMIPHHLDIPQSVLKYNRCTPSPAEALIPLQEMVHIFSLLVKCPNAISGMVVSQKIGVQG
ncbi:hypothetical protein J3R83DRAFT_2911 [Lanmaoa asiatica]|nr:hypothetical protein J3R83DRAFT_2911 [Lanmaoa asiatica]